jgi:hypothetical protein
MRTSIIVDTSIFLTVHKACTFCCSLSGLHVSAQMHYHHKQLLIRRARTHAHTHTYTPNARHATAVYNIQIC